MIGTSHLLTLFLPLLLAAPAPDAPATRPAADGVPRAVWMIHPDPLTPAERTLAATLQGCVAKQADDLTGRDVVWFASDGMNALQLAALRRDGADVRLAGGVWELLDVFADHVAGAVLYDASDGASLGAATTACGPLRAVAVDVALKAKAEEAGLEILEDVRGWDAARAAEAFGDRLARGRIADQKARIPAALRDWCVSENLFTFESADFDELTHYAKQFGAEDELTLAYGWGKDERRWVRALSEAGAGGLPADYSYNLSVLSRLPAEVPPPPEPPTAGPVRAGERIVAFVISDGDNLQWMAREFVIRPGFWSDLRRGTFPVTWEMAPTLADLAPRSIAHYYRTAAIDADGRALDTFVAGPSGVAYTFPHHLPDNAARKRWADATADTLAEAHLRLSAVLDTGGELEEMAPLLDHPGVDAVLYKDYSPYNRRRGAVWWHGEKPVVSFRFLLWEDFAPDSSIDGLAKAIADMATDPANDPASYALVNVHAWSYESVGGPLAAVRRVVDKLPPNTRLVSAAEFVQLLKDNRQALYPEQP